MKDEIKKILDYLKEYVETSKKETNKYKDGYIIYPTELGFIHCIKLLDYITNLQQKVDQYENPEDMTLFYMWLDAKAKDKIKQLEQENKKLLKKSYSDDVKITKVIEKIDKAGEHCTTPIFNTRGFLNDIKNTLNGGDDND